MRASRRLGALAAVVLALAVVTGSGAFDAVAAERTAVVDVAGDANGWLGLTPHSGPNGAYAYTVDADGTYLGQAAGDRLMLDLSGANPQIDSSGVNPDALGVVTDVFNVSNHGTQPVYVWTMDAADAVTFVRTDGTIETIETPQHAVRLVPGETTVVGLLVDTRGASAGDRLLGNVTIFATTEAPDGAAEPAPDAGTLDADNSSVVMTGWAFFADDVVTIEEIGYLRQALVVADGASLTKDAYAAFEFSNAPPDETWFPDSTFSPTAFPDSTFTTGAALVDPETGELKPGASSVLANAVVVVPASSFGSLPDLGSLDPAASPDLSSSTSNFPSWTSDGDSPLFAAKDLVFFPGDQFVTNPDGMDQTERTFLENGVVAVPLECALYCA